MTINMNEILSSLQGEHKQDDEERRRALILRAQTLQSLVKSEGFEEFLKTIAEDLQGFEHNRDNAKEYGDILEARALAVYAKTLLQRVSNYLSKAEEVAKIVQESEQDKENPGHPVY